MAHKTITQQELNQYESALQCEEKSKETIDKYMRDARFFLQFAKNQPITKALALSYKQSLVEQNYAIKSINSKIASLNSLLKFLGIKEACLKSLKQQRQIFSTEEKELTRAEYLRLLDASKANPRLHLLLQTICSTGIRVSELQYFTIESARTGKVSVRCKNKTRIILIPKKLCKQLLTYAKKQEIKDGIIFRTKHGKALDRSNIWAEMKKLCEKANVNPSKVFPHNLRKLFARSFYKIEKDIAKLADVLGHSSIETTRIYIMTTFDEHQRLIERLNLLRQ